MIFLLVGGVVSVLVSTASRRTVEAAHARAEAETLASLSGTLVAAADPLPQLVAQIQAAFEAESVGVLSRSPGSGWIVVAGVGPIGARRRPSAPTSRCRCRVAT